MAYVDLVEAGPGVAAQLAFVELVSAGPGRSVPAAVSSSPFLVVDPRNPDGLPTPARAFVWLPADGLVSEFVGEFV